MSEEEIERIIDEEFGDIFNISDEEIANLSFAESCIYLETLNRINDRIEELKKSVSKEGV